MSRSRMAPMRQARARSAMSPGAKPVSPASTAYCASRIRCARQNWWPRAAKRPLPAVAVGDPEVGPVLAEELREHPLAPAGIDAEHRAVAVVHHPEPGVLPRHPEPGLVGGEHRALQQPLAQPRRLRREGRRSHADDVDQPALADRHPEDVAEHPLQPREADVLAEAQVQRHRPQPLPERRAGRHVRGRGRLEGPGASGQVPPISVTRVTAGRSGMWMQVSVIG